jgi:DNA primase
VGSYFPLKRVGQSTQALPFHQERTPSFTVNPHRQIFKCFGCGVGGSVFRFVMNYENPISWRRRKSWPIARGFVSAKKSSGAVDEARVSMRRRLLALHEEAAEFFINSCRKNRSRNTLAIT